MDEIVEVRHKKHKKRKSERREKHSDGATFLADDESRQSTTSSLFTVPTVTGHHEKHKKSKKKKKKKERREKKHKRHHKDKKRRREESSQDDVSLNEDSLNDVPFKRLCDMNNPILLQVPHAVPQFTANDLIPTGLRIPRTCTINRTREEDRSALTRLLDYLVKVLEKRDSHRFFAWPVTDLIAPGYSHIITRPMDFSTMKTKIIEERYNTLPEFANDFKLMCNNAMEYNHVETVYYKAAKKLLHVGTKVFQTEKIRQLRGILPFIMDIPPEQLGFEWTHHKHQIEPPMDESQSQDGLIEPKLEPDKLDESIMPELIDDKALTKRNLPTSKFEAIADELTPAEILAQCQRASLIARQKLSSKVMAPEMGFLKMKKDGTTTLNILVGNDGRVSGTEKPISLGALVGKLTYGSGTMQGFKEDRRNNAKPVKPLYYGAFGSYAPSYDSTFANLTKDESDLILQTYGDENAVQYAESIINFARDCDYTVHMVDNLLDILTGGDHGKTKKILDDRRKLREEEDLIKELLDKKSDLPETNVSTNEKIDITNLKTLESIGIDVSFLDRLDEQQKIVDEQQKMQTKLEKTCELIEKLQQTQMERLSQPPPTHLALVVAPGDGEIQIADKITDNLTAMTKRVTPSDVVSVTAVRKSMGLTAPEATFAANDLETELRAFLENAEPNLAGNTIEEILMEQ